MSDLPTFALALERREGYEFTTRFDWETAAPLLVDEPVPLGSAKGPNASRLVGAAVGNCLSASLLFCLERAKQQVNGIRTDVQGSLRRAERGRLRLGRLDVRIVLDVTATEPERVGRCLALFEDYCVVTGSVRKGIQVDVLVTDPSGTELYRRVGDPATD